MLRKGVLNADANQLMTVNGIGQSAAVGIKMVVELNKRVANNRNKNVDNLNCSSEAIAYCSNLFKYEKVEKLYMITLNNDGSIINIHLIGEGNANTAPSNTREILEAAIIDKASGVLFTHNHPNGSSKASDADLNFSVSIDNVLKNVDINFIDHIINGNDPYYPEFWEGKSIKEAVMSYFEAILRNVTTYENYDVYGHLDYIRRYIPDKEYVYVDNDFYEITEMIFKNIIFKGKGIELNTRALTSGITNFIPTITLLKRFRDLGGEIVTLGSDSHYVKNLGYAFTTAKDILINTGFRYVTTFEHRTPSFIKL